MNEKDIHRFWSKVDMGPDDECWEWTASTTQAGYGKFRLDGSIQRANRVAFHIEYGEPEEDVLHHCDNPSCVNPRHLYDGDTSDNMRDALERGQLDPNDWAVLTEEEVREIRESDEHPRKVADEYDISRSHVYNIRAGRRGNR